MTIKLNGYRLTEAMKIPKSWDFLSINDLVKKSIIDKPLDGNHGNIHPKASDFCNKGIPFIMSNNIDNQGNIDFVSCKFIPKELADKLQKGFAKQGDILLTHKGSVGRVSVVPDIPYKYLMLTPQVTYYRINQPNLLDNLYLKFIFQGEFFQRQLSVYSGGGTRAYIGITNQGKLFIPLPPLPEQKAIASILTVCDETIEQTQKLIEKLELRHKSLCQQLLFNPNRGPKLIGEFITYTPREVTKPLENYLGLGVRSHAKGLFQKPNSDPSKNAMTVLFEVKSNDLVMSITFAREHAVAIASELDEGGLVSHRFPTYVFNNKVGNSDFFKHFIKQKKFKYQLGVISPGGAGRNRVMSKKDFIKLKIKVPNYEDQIRISKILDHSQLHIDTAKEKLTKLQEKKKGLMQQLLTGKTRVPKEMIKLYS